MVYANFSAFSYLRSGSGPHPTVFAGQRAQCMQKTKTGTSSMHCEYRIKIVFSISAEPVKVHTTVEFCSYIGLR